MPSKDIPALSGIQLIELFLLAGWQERGIVRHGVFLVKYDCDIQRERWVTIPRKRKSLPKNTLHCILSVKQSGLGRTGLQRLIEEFGIP